MLKLLQWPLLCAVVINGLYAAQPGCTIKAAADLTGLATAVASNELQDTLVVFDVENTLFKDGTTAEPKRVSEILPGLLTTMKSKNLQVIAITQTLMTQEILSSTTESAPDKKLAQEWYPAILQRLEITTERFFPTTATVVDLGLGTGTGVHHGIIYAGKTSKAKALRAFLTTFKLSPKQILLIDDGMPHHFLMLEELRQAGIAFLGLYYTEARTPAKSTSDQEKMAN
jgi:hypothetical protein